MEEVPFSAIRVIFEEAQRLEAEGKPVIHLEVGRPDFDTPDHIKAAAKRALDEGKVHYTSNYGIPDLRLAIAEKLERDNGLSYDPDNEIIVVVGAVEAVFVAMMSLLNPGDEILIPDPSWLNYFHCARMAGARPVSVPLLQEEGFRLNPDRVRDAITPRTRGLVVISPHNPTGSVLEEDALSELADIVLEHDLFVISDEIYEKLIYDGLQHRSITNISGMQERTVLINGFSKAYSMTGWRLGYLAVSRAFADVLIRLHQYVTACATSFAQWGGIAAYRGPQQCVGQMVNEFDRRRQLVLRELNGMDGITCAHPQGAFYAFPSIGSFGRKSEEMAHILLQEAYVALAPGSAFGEHGEGYLRISYSNSYQNLEEALKRMRETLSELA
jgi:aspartate/methionine/tyrosine aminotransferase